MAFALIAVACSGSDSTGGTSGTAPEAANAATAAPATTLTPERAEVVEAREAGEATGEDTRQVSAGPVRGGQDLGEGHRPSESLMAVDAGLQD